MNTGKSITKDSDILVALKTAGFGSITKLLKAIDVIENGREIAEQLDIDVEAFLAFVGRAELTSLRGLGKAYVDLLIAAGIETKAQLRKCDPFELHEAIKQVALRTSLGRVPNRATIEEWIEQARK